MAERAPAPTQTGPHDWFGYAYLLIFLAGVGFFLLSFVALGVLPGLRLTDKMESVPQSDIPAYTPAELRGRRVYASLGCALCHTPAGPFSAGRCAPLGRAHGSLGDALRLSASMGDTPHRS